MNFLMEHWGLIVSVLLGLSETMALIPQFKSSGILDFVIKVLKELKSKTDVAK